MKKIITLIFIFVLFLCVRVNAKELYAKQIKIDPTTSYSSNYVIIHNDDGTSVSFGDARFNGYQKFYDDYYKFIKYSADGEYLIEKEYTGKRFLINAGIRASDGNYVVVGFGECYESNDCDGSPGLIGKYNNNGEIIWIKELSLPYDNPTFYGVIETSDNGFIAVGSYSSKGIIAKFDSNGVLEWYKDYLVDSSDHFDKVIETSNHQYIVYGLKYQYYPNVNIHYILKYDKDGNLLGDRVVIPTSLDFIRLVDDGYFVTDSNVSENNKNINIYKYDFSGNLIKSNTIQMNKDEKIYDLIVSHDNNYIIAGDKTNETTDSDDYNKTIFTMKYDFTNNSIKWKKDIDLGIEYYDPSISLYETSSNEISIGYIFSNDTYLVRYNSSGKLLNSKKIKNILETMYTSGAYYNSKDDSVIFAGSSYRRYPTNRRSDIIFSKYDNNGNLTKETVWGGDKWDGLSTFKEISTGGFIAVGYTNSTEYTSSGRDNGIILKLNNNLEVVWYKVFDATGDVFFADVIELQDGGFLAVGDVYASNSSTTALVVKYDKNGNVLWNYDYSLFSFSKFNSVTQLKDGTIIVVGSSEETHYSNEEHSYLIKIDSDGFFEGLESSVEAGHSYNKILSTNDGGYIILGQEKYDDGGKYFYWLSKYDKNGEFEWEYKYKDGKGSAFRSVLELSQYYAVAGFVEDEDNFIHSTVLYIDKNGELLEQTSFGDGWSYPLEIYKTSVGVKVACSSVNVETEGYPFLYDLYYMYDITPKAVTVSKGTYTIDKVKAFDKELVTITVIPAFGYVFDKVVMTDSRGNVTEFRTLTFEMIPDDVEIEVVFRELINPQTGFSLISLFAIVGGLVFITIRNKKKTLTN